MGKNNPSFPQNFRIPLAGRSHNDATAEEAKEETLRMLHVYESFYKEILAIPAVIGRKTEKEKFAVQKKTYTIEPMMHNGVALQGGTSHYFGDGFAKSFGITFTGKDNKQHYPHQTSWGVSTRMIGAIIMVHGDDDGLVLPAENFTCTGCNYSCCTA